MKLKIIYLLFLYCFTLYPFTAYGYQKTVNISTDGPGEEQKNNVADTVKPDTVIKQEAIRMIRDFYKIYTMNILSGISSSDLPVKKYLTQRLIEKTDRIRTATDSDPVIRAQDFRKDVIETLSVGYLDKNWYMIGYTWDGKHTDIPLRVTRTNGQYMIDYITPVWNGSLYGDSLFFDNPEPQTIDASTPLCLLKTFYAAYTLEYCSMPENLTLRLAALRAAYLTPNASAQFEYSVNKYKLDGRLNYDLLIDYFDFDRLWLPSMKFSQSSEDTCLTSYTRGNIPCTVKLKVIRQGEEYRIDSITKHDM
ncbi:MAG: DUF3828 domain-containing protein [Prevotella sp.]|jgi:hypothetical protein|nr:DUF3828 domain-containing protein [Prevotella sp.]